MKYILEYFGNDFISKERQLNIKSISEDGFFKLVADKLKLTINKFLGKGSRGIAYLCKDNIVLKISSDKKEVCFYIETQNSDCKRILTSKRLYKIISPYCNESYAIILNQVEPLGEMEAKIIMDFYITFYYFTNFIEGTNTNDMNIDLEEWIEKHHPNNSKLCRSLLKEYSEVYKEVEKFGGETDELHVDNLGKDKNGSLIALDMTNIKISKEEQNKILNNLPKLHIW